MPEHKMVTIGGIRVRAEDEARYRARTGESAGTPAGPLTQAHADPRTQEKQDPDTEDALFDPAEHTVLQVISHLAEADEAETARVLDVEAEGEKRKGLLERREEFLAEARQRAAGGSGGGA
ncbi:hypothetical protein C1I97_03440 [Streptomyces sp. NTH33]|uniref:hypothetical protein n=1 Tax=Streptomyces sp. NTH33 TaxID=1735453 RepID=UPI000DA7B8CB|nr:hypothetical protein [Streptomyces sp. NTH33]PZH18764.1 hypothetical protein C1I97_03440 [Streptomyces sp. NTH33]